MKSRKDLEIMLVSEICSNLDFIKKEITMDCYNEFLGDSSFLLSGILEKELEIDSYWDSNNWMDDSLVHKIYLEENKIRCWGVIIWGKYDTTEQWTDPFYCEFSFDCKSKEIFSLTFLFGDQESAEITYEEFVSNRAFWDRDFYSDDFWAPSERNWKFIFNSTN